MALHIERLCHVQKRMQTSADKSGDDEVVNCHIGVKGVRVHREQAEELGGLPIGTTVPLFDESGIPRQRMSFLFPKRELLGTGSIEHRKDSGVRVAGLELVEALVSDMRFNLDAPEEGNTTYLMSFSLAWKAGGDEVDQVRALLNKKGCFLNMRFKDAPTQIEAKLVVPKAAPKPDRKRVAAGEKPDDATVPQDDDELLSLAKEFVERTKRASPAALQTQFKIGYNRAARLLEALEVLKVVGPIGKLGGREVLAPFQAKPGGMAELQREAAAKAKKHPRREAPNPRKKR